MCKSNKCAITSRFSAKKQLWIICENGLKHSRTTTDLKNRCCPITVESCLLLLPDWFGWAHVENGLTSCAHAAEHRRGRFARLLCEERGDQQTKVFDSMRQNEELNEMAGISKHTHTLQFTEWGEECLSSSSSSPSSASMYMEWKLLSAHKPNSLTTFLHHLKCLALRRSTWAQFVLRFDQFLGSHFQVLLLLLFLLTWLKGQNISQKHLELPYLQKVLSTTCCHLIWPHLRHVGGTVEILLGILLSVNSFSLLPHTQSRSDSPVDNKSVRKANKWRNVRTDSSSCLSLSLWFLSCLPPLLLH